METNSNILTSTNPAPPDIPIINFTAQLTCLKNSISLWEDLVSKSNKLSTALRTVVQCIAGFLESLQRIADVAYNSNCGLRELGGAMTRFCLRERAMEVRLKNLNSQLTDCLAAPLALRLEEWRRAVAQLDRENSKEWRRARGELVRASGEMDKLQKRFHRKLGRNTKASAVTSKNDLDEPLHTKPDQANRATGDNLQLNFVQQDLILKKRTLAELERLSLRKAVVEDRRRFAELMTCLKPVLDCQTSLFSDAAQLEESVSAVVRTAFFDPNELSAETEQTIEVSVEHQLAALSAPSTVENRLLASGVRNMRLLKNFSSSRVDLTHTNHHHSNNNNTGTNNNQNNNSTSSSATNLSLAGRTCSTSSNGGGSSAWAAVAASAVAMVRQNSSLTTCRSRSPSSTGEGRRSRDLGDSSAVSDRTAAPPSQLTATIGQMGHKSGQGDALSLFEQHTEVYAARMHGDASPADYDLPAPVDSEDFSVSNGLPTSTRNQSGGGQTRFGVRTDHVTGEETLVESRNAAGKKLVTEAANHQDLGDDDEEDDEEEDGHRVRGTPGSGSGSTDDQLSEDRLSRDDDEVADEEGYGSAERLAQKSFLYPNQVLPAPVYTNLSELKRAAARKFSGSQADVSRPISRLGFGAAAAGGVGGDGRRGADTTSLHGGLLPHSPGLNESPHLDSGRQVSQDDFYSLGTSTFGRRQSEYARMGVNAAIRCSGAGVGGGAVDLSGVDYQTGKIYSSVTPGLVRRGSALTTAVDGSSCAASRPVHPPRRSSSVCRMLPDQRPATPPAVHLGIGCHGDYAALPVYAAGAQGPPPVGGVVFSVSGNEHHLQPTSGYTVGMEAGNPAYSLPPLAACATGPACAGRPAGPMSYGVKAMFNQDPIAPVGMTAGMGNVSRLPMQRGMMLGRNMSCETGRIGRNWQKFGYHGDAAVVAGRMNGDVPGGQQQQQLQRQSRASPGLRGDRITSFIE